jgi:ribonuclease P protein component
MATLTFNKQEKLKSRKLTKQLFAEGKSFLVFPVKVVYLPITEVIDCSIKIGVSASSRTFKHAVDRNRIKRVLKEQYRLNKLPLHQYMINTKQQIAIFFIFIDKTLPEKGLVERKMPIIINKLIQNLNETIVTTT